MGHDLRWVRDVLRVYTLCVVLKGSQQESHHFGESPKKKMTQPFFMCVLTQLFKDHGYE